MRGLQQQQHLRFAPTINGGTPRRHRNNVGNGHHHGSCSRSKVLSILDKIRSSSPPSAGISPALPAAGAATAPAAVAVNGFAAVPATAEQSVVTAAFVNGIHLSREEVAVNGYERNMVELFSHYITGAIYPRGRNFLDGFLNCPWSRRPLDPNCHDLCPYFRSGARAASSRRLTLFFPAVSITTCWRVPTAAEPATSPRVGPKYKKFLKKIKIRQFNSPPSGLKSASLGSINRSRIRMQLSPYSKPN